MIKYFFSVCYSFSNAVSVSAFNAFFDLKSWMTWPKCWKEGTCSDGNSFINVSNIIPFFLSEAGVQVALGVLISKQVFCGAEFSVPTEWLLRWRLTEMFLHIKRLSLKAKKSRSSFINNNQIELHKVLRMHVNNQGHCNIRIL